jgi:sugar lactone lactonase YvrE
MSQTRVAAIQPLRAVEGGRITIVGQQLMNAGEGIPEVQVGGHAARVVFASSSAVSVIVPGEIADEGPAAVKLASVPGETAFVHVAAPLATGLHQVDSPTADADGNLYFTFSGTRGQQVPVSIYRVGPTGTRETFATGIVNPTSMAVDRDGQLYVSSRFESTVYRVDREGTVRVFASDLGVACGLAFASDGSLYVGDRSGTVFKVAGHGRAKAFATLPASVAAFHLAFGPDDVLYVTAPTLSTYDSLFRITPSGEVTALPYRFGRPQGLAVDASGVLFVVEALAGASGVYRIVEGRDPELYLAGPNLVGVTFGPDGSLVVCSNETAYRLRGR